MRRVYPAASAQRSVVSRRLTLSVMGATLAQKFANSATRRRGSASADRLAQNKNRQCLAKPAETVYCFSENNGDFGLGFLGAAIYRFGAADDSLMPPQVFEIAQNGLVNNEPALRGENRRGEF
jgi:hypothetical protein